MRHKILTQYLTDKEMDLKYDEIKKLKYLSGTRTEFIGNRIMFYTRDIVYIVDISKICRIKPFNPNEVNPKSSIELDEELFISKIIVRNYINNATLIYVNKEKQNEVDKERNREYDY